MEGRAERRDLFEQTIRQLLAGHHRQRRNVVDRLLRIKFGALAARTIEHVDDMRLEIEQPQLEYGKEPHWPRANDDNVGFVGLTRFRGRDLSGGGVVFH